MTIEIIQHNVETGHITTVELTGVEEQAFRDDQAAIAAENQARIQRRQQLLAKLGLTEDELSELF